MRPSYRGTWPFGRRAFVFFRLVSMITVLGITTRPAYSQDVSFDHSKCKTDAQKNCLLKKELTLRHGQVFTVLIQNTYPDLFNYIIETVPRPAERIVATARPQKRDTLLSHVFDSSYAGYNIHIRAKEDKTEDLADAHIVIEAKSKQSFIKSWPKSFEVSVDGSYFITGLMDHAFGVTSDTTLIDVPVVDANGMPVVDENMQPLLQQEEQVVNRLRRFQGSEDRFQTGAAALVNFRHRELPIIGGTVGIGIRGDARMAMFLGGHLNFGSVSFVFGSLWAPVRRLPPGLILEQEVQITDANDLVGEHLSMRRSWFVGFSLSFLTSPQTVLDKPFAPSPVPDLERTSESTAASGGQDATGPGKITIDKDTIRCDTETNLAATISKLIPQTEVIVVSADSATVKVKMTDGNDAPGNKWPANVEEYKTVRISVKPEKGKDNECNVSIDLTFKHVDANDNPINRTPEEVETKTISITVIEVHNARPNNTGSSFR